MDELTDDAPPLQRAAAWFRATPLELAGLAVLLVGALAASVALWWQATSRPSELPSAVLDVGGDGVVAADQVGGPGPDHSPVLGAPSLDVAGPDAGGEGQADGTTPGDDTAAGGVGADGAGGAGDGAPESAGPLTVHVTGAVLEPGLVEVAAGARVGDAVRAAGGLSPDADPDLINLARPLGDGEHVRMPRAGDDPVPDAPAPGGPNADATAPGGAGSAGSTPTGADPPVLVDVNHATPAELETLPGIGPARAEAIVAHRDAHGPFQVPGDLRAVSGIGEATFQRLADLITVG